MAKRRKKGTGRVYEYPKKSGQWWAQLPERDGKSGPKWRVKVKDTGNAELDEKLAQLKAGIKVYERVDLFGELVMQCIEAATNIGLTTYETYRQHARLYVLSQPIADIRVADLRAWVAGIAKVKSQGTKKRLSGNTIRHAYDRIRVALLIAFEDKRIDWLPPKTLKLPRVEEVERRALAMEECNKLIDYATNLRLAMMFKTYISTGMRESELIGLLWEMIDWQRKEINLTSQLKSLREEKRWERMPLKNRKRRRIPVDDDYLAELRAHRVRQMEEKLRRGEEWKENGLVFPTSVGTPFSPRNLIDDLERDAKKAEIGKVTVHELRHTAGSLMLQAGKTMTTVNKILGHSSVGVTEKIYAHAFDDDKRDAVSSVSRRLRRVGGNQE
ncbi:MAG TPA: site-specific integrase [Roseiflexaceae bacterium]|nr:site-specific integrase [Roseiflexaceae bacterium]